MISMVISFDRFTYISLIRRCGRRVTFDRYETSVGEHSDIDVQKAIIVKKKSTQSVSFDFHTRFFMGTIALIN